MADPVNRLTAALTALIRELFPNWAYASVYRYTATACDFENQTIDARPASASVGLPPLAKIPLRSPVKVEVQQGASLGIGFLDSDPTQPYVAALDQNMVITRATIRAEGVLELGESATMQVARQGDLALVGGNGMVVAFFPPAPASVAPPAPLMTNTVYQIAFGNSLSGMAPTPYPAQSPAVGFVASGSLLTKTH